MERSRVLQCHKDPAICSPQTGWDPQSLHLDSLVLYRHFTDVDMMFSNHMVEAPAKLWTCDVGMLKGGSIAHWSEYSIHIEHTVVLS